MFDKQLEQTLDYFLAKKIDLSEKQISSLMLRFPEDPRPLIIKSARLIRKHKYAESLNFLRKATQLDSSNYLVHYFSGIVFEKLNMFQESVNSYQNSFNLNSNHYETQINLANLLMSKGYYEDALTIYINASKINPSEAIVYNNIGLIYKHFQSLNLAVENFQKALSLKNNYLSAIYNLGSSYRSLGEIKNALDCYQNLLNISPKYYKAYYGLGVTFYYYKNLNKSIFNLNQAIKFKSNYVKSYQFLSRILLSHKGYQNEYKNLIANYDPITVNQKKFERHIWKGEKDKILLIRKAKDLGDFIIYSSVLKELHSISKKIIFECDKRLFSLFKRSLPQDITFIENAEEYYKFNKNIEFETLITELFYFFRKSSSEFDQTPMNYLLSDKNQTLFYKSKIASNGKKKIIGLSWKTLTNKRHALRRNINLEDLIRTINDANTIFLNLQYGDVINEIAEIEKKLAIKIENFEEINNFYHLDSLASLICICDYVVTIDNTTAHLAGALGVKTKLMLDSTPSEFWGNEKKDNYLYKSIEIFRQQEENNWNLPLEDLRKAIFE